MGCVSLSRACFDDGKITESRLREAELRVQLRLEPVREEYVELGWQIVTGASGSIKAIQDVVAREGWGPGRPHLGGLRRLRTALLDAGQVAAVASRWQLEPARAKVFAGGFVVLHGLCEALKVERLAVSEGALREGVIYDLLGRIRHEDVRDRTIAAVIERYGMDRAQAERVSSTARELLSTSPRGLGLGSRGVRSRFGMGGALARDRDVAGLSPVSQDMGRTSLQHADLPGFSQSDQTLLAALDSVSSPVVSSRSLRASAARCGALGAAAVRPSCGWRWC
jgi:exopolyphosphatase/guanosine-5'-triphosphate,3'-diphosphate pyrophosphatase